MSIHTPNIAVERVENGYVVEWKRLDTTPSANRTNTVTAVCYTSDELLRIIERATTDINEIRKPT